MSDFPITAEMVVEAYAKTRLTPTQAAWFIPGDMYDHKLPCACGLGAIIAFRVGLHNVDRIQKTTKNEPDGIAGYIAAGFVLGIGSEQIRSFANGFDGHSPRCHDDPAFQAGRRSAQAVGLIPPD